MPELDRRSFLAAGAATAAGLLMPLPANARRSTLPPTGLAPLAHNLREERDYQPRVEGQLPRALQGTLFRNGPGLFERNGQRKATILDGDGMIQAFDFDRGRVRYRNRFVRTHKFVEEEAAGRFLHPTWTSLADGWHRNLPGIPTQSQAGVVPVVKHGQLLALDEVGEPWSLDPRSLETLGEHPLGQAGVPLAWKAHTKTDGKTGDWIAVGAGEDQAYHVVVRNARGELVETHRVDVGGRTYVHDFFATPHYVVLNIHPVSFGAKGLLMLTGFATVRDAMEWHPERGNRVVVIDRRGGTPPLELEAPAAWMWHSVNAFERGGEIVADFIGYDTPDHFLGEDAALAAIMHGRRGLARSPGSLRRYRIDLSGKTLRQEILDSANHEFPYVDPRVVCRPYESVWACTAESGIFHDGLVRIDLASGKRDSFHFGPGHQVGEPVLAAGLDGEPAWLLALVFRESSATSQLAVLPAGSVADGPVALVELNHHAPYSFHGTWWPSA